MNIEGKTLTELTAELDALRMEYRKLNDLFQQNNAALKQAEEQALYEKSFRNSIELSLNSGIAIVDSEGRQTYVSPYFCRLVGWSKEELVGKTTPHIYWPPEHLQNIQDAFQSTITNNAPQDGFDLVFMRKDGTRIPVQVIISPFSDGRHETGWLANVINLGERKLAEREVTQTRQFLNSIIEHSPNAMWISDENGTMIRLNQACRDNLKIRDEEVVGKYNLFNDNLVQEQGYMPVIKDVFEKGITARFVIHYDTSALKNIQLEQTTEVYLIVNISPIFGEKGNVTHAIIQHNDISELKKAEKALRASEALYRAILNASPDDVTITDLNGKVLMVSDAALPMFGIAGREDIIGRSLLEFVAPEDHERAIANLEGMYSGIKRGPTEYLGLRSDGSTLNVEVNGEFVKDETGNPIYMIFVVRDITQRKQVDATIRKSEEKFRNLFNNAEVGMFRTRLDGSEVLDCNKKFLKIFNYDYDEVIGHPSDRLWANARERDRLLQHLTTSDRVDEFKSSVINKQGEERECIFSLHLYRDIGIIEGSIQDITEQRAAERALKESERRLSDIIFSVGDWVWELDKDEIYTYCSPKGFEILQRSRENVIGKTPYDFMPTGETERIKAIINDIASKKAPIKDLENWVVNHDGDEICLLTNGVPIIDDQGNLKGYRGVDKDITQRKKIELELIEAKERAEESDRLKTAFLENMSHEIRTPMNGILGFSSLLKDQDLSIEEQQKYIEVIEKSGLRLLNIITDLVDIAKIESGQMKVFLKEDNLNEKTEYIFNFFKPQTDRNGLELFVENGLPNHEAIIRTDHDKVLAVLTNLLNNAIKFTHSGFIKFGYQKAGDHLVFFVTDTGEGIRKEQQVIIFERFRQGDKLVTRNYEGTGLGLSISKAFVEMLGGKIWVESEFGKGSTFYFTLPLSLKCKEGERLIKTPKVNFSEQPGKKVKILVAEDDENSILLFMELIRKIEAEILTASNGVEVVEICRNNPDVALILMDIKMPEMNGYEATRQIRKFNKDIPIIAQTAFAMVGDEQHAFDAGCNDYITKPINVRTINDIINKYLYRKLD